MIKDSAILYSIIMPVYNAEEFIEEAILSVLSQIYSKWELICVDDGSSDMSYEIIEKYSKKDERIKLYKVAHKGNASAVRNEAIKKAKGDYYVTLDADDKFDSYTLEILNKRVLETDADFVVADIYYWDYVDDLIKKKLTGIKGDIEPIISGVKAFIYSLDWTIASVGAIRSSVVNKNKYFEKGMNGDEFSSRLFLLSSKSVAFSNARYYYRNNYKSASKKDSIKLFFILDTDLELLKLVSKEKRIKHLRGKIERKYIHVFGALLIKYLYNRKRYNNSERIILMKYFREHEYNIKEFTIFSLRRCLVLFIWRLIRIKY